MGRNIYAWVRTGLALCAPVLLGGCKMALLEPEGSIGRTEKGLILTATILMLMVVIPVIIMTILFAYKYRASNQKAEYKPDWAFSHKIEITVWAIPCMIVLGLSIICWGSTHRLDPAQPLSSAKPLEIDVVALDWKWLFIYPEQHIASVNQIAIPVDMPVKFVITSDTVMNSFFIPQLGSQIYAMTGMKARLNLVANAPGVYDGLSANFSGDGFSGMHFKVLAGSQADFAAWVAKAGQSAVKLDASNYAALARPSEDNPVQYFIASDPGLFDGIVKKYMDMPARKNDTMKMGMDSMPQEQDNVR